MPLLAALFFAAGLFSACAGRVETLQALPEALRGKVRIVDVRVERRRGVGSPEIESLLRQALVEALDKAPEEGPAMNLVVLIEDYYSPEGQIGGKRTSRLQGRVYIVDWDTGAPLAEFRPIARSESGNLSAPGSAADFTDVRRALIDRFVAAVIEEIS